MDVAKIESFLQDFRTFDEENRRRRRTLDAENHRRRLSELDSYLEQLGGILKHLRAMATEQNRLCAPHFNVFHLLGIERKEALLHTKLLAALLNPKGSHGQGFLFLKLFFDVAKRAGLIVPPQPVEQDHWMIRREVSAGAGNRLDLLIESRPLRYIAVIENKIGAGERENQLSDYGEWMEAYRRNYQNRQLVFLTIDGQMPTTAGKFTTVCLSYQNDITDWLNDCAKSVNATPVKAILNQYLAVIEDLT